MLKLLSSLKNNGKSPGPDGLRKEDLTIDSAMAAKCFTYIYNTSYNTSVVPAKWKLAHVAPLHNRGAMNEANNYRPISLTSIPCKLMEHIVLHYLNEKLEQVLPNWQHGFRQGLSCETQLCSTFHDITRSADRGDTIHAAVLDFAKAFDKVPHQLLMNKLTSIPDLCGSILMWIHNFWCDRKQRVVVNGCKFGELSVTSEVSQGSVLGPKLSLIYTMIFLSRLTAASAYSLMIL